jgi:hypothetical protein
MDGDGDGAPKLSRPGEQHGDEDEEGGERMAGDGAPKLGSDEDPGMGVDDDAFMGHTLRFPEDGEESIKAGRDYEVIDPRQRGARARKRRRGRGSARRRPKAGRGTQALMRSVYVRVVYYHFPLFRA